MRLVHATDDRERHGRLSWPSIVKVTVPVGVPWNPGAVTTAVNVTCWPTVDGFNGRHHRRAWPAAPACQRRFENAEVSPTGSVAVAV